MQAVSKHAVHSKGRRDDREMRNARQGAFCMHANRPLPTHACLSTAGRKRIQKEKKNLVVDVSWLGQIDITAYTPGPSCPPRPQGPLLCIGLALKAEPSSSLHPPRPVSRGSVSSMTTFHCNGYLKKSQMLLTDDAAICWTFWLVRMIWFLRNANLNLF